MDTMIEEIWTIENALNRSLSLTKEKTAEIRDTGKLVRKFKADFKSLYLSLSGSQ